MPSEKINNNDKEITKESTLEKALKLSNDEELANAIKDLLKRDDGHFLN